MRLLVRLFLSISLLSSKACLHGFLVHGGFAVAAADPSKVDGETTTMQSSPVTTSSSPRQTTTGTALPASSPSNSNEAYHLIWSPNAREKILWGLWTIFWAHRCALGFRFSLPSFFVSSSPFSTAWSNLALPLLASSCCLIQLGINLLAGGCAGFNTLLGPSRPYFLSLLLYGTFWGAQWSSWRWYATSLLRWTVALLPEALDVYNNNRHWVDSSSDAASTTTTTTSPRQLTLESAPWQASVQLDIPTMGCVACVNKIDAALHQAGPHRVLEAAASLNPLGSKGGYAKVRLVGETRDEIDTLVESLVQNVEAAGFEPCHLGTLHIQEKQEASANDE